MRIPELQSDWPESWRMCWMYDERETFGVNGWRAYRHGYQERLHSIVDIVEEECRPGGRVLDAGAAQGTMTLALAERGFEVTWNDLRAELADYVALKHERGLVHYQPGNIFETPLAEFDLILAAELIEHVARPDDLLRQLASLLAPGAALVVTTPNGRNLLNRLPNYSDVEDPSALEGEQFKPDSDGHLFLLTASELVDVARGAGLRAESVWFVQTYLAHGVERVSTRLLRPKAVTRTIGVLDRALLRVPVVAERLAVQMIGVLRREDDSPEAVLVRSEGGQAVL